MSELRVSNLKGRRRGQLPALPDGAVVTGVTTSTTFDGNLTGNVTGNITATTGTFSGDVSVGGAISYEDVSDVDSVGVITARSGIKVGAGQSISPVSGTLTYYGDGSGLTGVNAGSHNFVASGAIPNGSTVVINTDGTVGVVTITGSTDPSAGTPSVFESATIDNVTATYDSTNDKVVIAYRDVGNSSAGTAVVGTVSGTSISFGTPVVYNSGYSSDNSAVFDSANGKVVISYRDDGNSNYGRSVVGTVSGTSISFGSPVAFETASTVLVSSTYDSANGKVVICYRDGGNSSYGTAIVGTVSGNSISFGSATVFESGNASDISATYDSANGKIVVAYTDTTNSFVGTAAVGTVSGTSISFGSPVIFQNSYTGWNSAVYDSANGKVVISYVASGGKSIIGTVSGTSISFGSPVTFNASTSELTSTYDSNKQKVVISYRDTGNSSYGTSIVGTVSGTSISFGNEVVFETAATEKTASTFDSTTNQVIVAYRDEGNSSYGTGVVVNSDSLGTNLTSENYIGIAAEAISDGQTGKVTIVTGINEGQTGLTTGKTYYVQSSGGISTVADTPSVIAGTSISSTKIAVR